MCTQVMCCRMHMCVMYYDTYICDVLCQSRYATKLLVLLLNLNPPSLLHHMPWTLSLQPDECTADNGFNTGQPQCVQCAWEKRFISGGGNLHEHHSYCHDQRCAQVLFLLKSTRYNFAFTSKNISGSSEISRWTHSISLAKEIATPSPSLVLKKNKNVILVAVEWT